MDDNQNHQSPSNNGPADTLRDGHLKASIWRNEGEKGHFFSTTLARTYEDREGNLKDSQSFASNDLLRVSELARSAYTRSRELDREQAQEHEMQQQPEPVQELAPEPERETEPEQQPAPVPEPDREQRRQEFEAQRREPEPTPTRSHDQSH